MSDEAEALRRRRAAAQSRDERSRADQSVSGWSLLNDAISEWVPLARKQGLKRKGLIKPRWYVNHSGYGLWITSPNEWVLSWSSDDMSGNSSRQASSREPGRCLVSAENVAALRSTMVRMLAI